MRLPWVVSLHVERRRVGIEQASGVGFHYLTLPLLTWEHHDEVSQDSGIDIFLE